MIVLSDVHMCLMRHISAQTISEVPEKANCASLSDLKSLHYARLLVISFRWQNDGALN